jgi:hypothetical protein
MYIMKKKIIVILVLAIISIFFFLYLIPIKNSSVTFEKSSFSLESCPFKISSWNNQEFATPLEPDHIYLDQMKDRIISSGISEDYFNRNIRMVYAELKPVNDRTEIIIYYKINTNSWLDNYNQNYGNVLCDKNTDCSICKQYVTLVNSWINLNYSDYTKPGYNPIVYSASGIIWHDSEVVSKKADFTEIKSLMGPWKAGLLAKSCILFSINSYSVHSAPGMAFEYVVNGESLSTLFDKMNHMQARVNLATGKVDCQKQASIVY